LIGNDINSNRELQITIKKNMNLPCPKRGEKTHALSEAVGNTALNLFFPTHFVLFPSALI
jgi:hypothetical protein